MARTLKQGVDYFPLDVHLDDKFRFIQIKFGLEGFAIIIKLLQKIYSCGYWYQWGEDEQLIFKNENHIDCDILKKVMDEALKRGIFNKEMFNKHGILTSSGIQKRYKEIVRRRKNVEITTEYLLIDGITEVNDSNKTTSSQHNDGKSTQRKGKERKGNETKLKESKEENKNNLIPYQEIVDLFNEICTESPRVTVISKKRKEKIAQRYKELGDIETFKEAFNKVSESDFLSGRSKESWIVKFDWLMENDTNILKVLEGNYKNKPKRNHEGREIDDSVEIDF